MADRVLLVDDEVEFVDALAERMRARGLEVDTANDGQTAIGLAAKARYDAIVLDLAMPGMDGMQTLEGLRADNPNLQIILLTGQGTVQTAVEATKLGAMDFLEKPTAIEDLLVKIRKARSNRLALELQKSEEEISDLLLRRGW